MKKKQNDWDDGRTIAPMNVEGMPWYTPKKENEEAKGDEIQLSKKETWAMLKGVLGASMLVALVFVAFFALFIFFCVFVWFK